MSKFCRSCNFELSDTDNVCPNCGQLREEEPDVSAAVASGEVAVNEDVIPTQEPPKRKLKWWMIAIPAVLVVALLFAILWNPLFLRIAPEAVLGAAFAEAGTELSRRLEGSPLTIVNALDEPDRLTMRYGLDYLDNYGNRMDMDFTVLVDYLNAREQVGINISQMGANVDLMLYMDRDFLALSSEALTDGASYGVTYDTFLSDAQSNPLFESVATEDLEAIQSVFDTISDSLEVPTQNSAYTEEYRAVFIDFIDGLKPVVQQQTRLVDGQQVKCDAVVYHVTADDLAQLTSGIYAILEQDEPLRQQIAYAFGFMDEGETTAWDSIVKEIEGSSDEEVQLWMESVAGELTASFYLYRKNLVGVGFNADFRDDESTLKFSSDLSFGTDLSKDDITAVITVHDPDNAENEVTLTCTISTQQSEDTYAETLFFQGVDEDGIEYSTELSYNWKDRSDMSISVLTNDGFEDHSFQANMFLQETETGIAVELDNLFTIMSAMAGDPDAYDGAFMALRLEISEGAEIAVPTYKNLDAWTQDDLISILSKLLYSFV